MKIYIEKEKLKRMSDDELTDVYHNPNVINRKDSIAFLSGVKKQRILNDSENDMRLVVTNYLFGELNKKIEPHVREYVKSNRDDVERARTSLRTLNYINVLGSVQNADGAQINQLNQYMEDVDLVDWLHAQFGALVDFLIENGYKKDEFRSFLDEPYLFADAYIEMLKESGHIYHPDSIWQLFSLHGNKPACNLSTVINKWAYRFHYNAYDLSHEMIVRWCNPDKLAKMADVKTLRGMCAFLSRSIHNMCIDEVRKRDSIFIPNETIRREIEDMLNRNVIDEEELGTGTYTNEDQDEENLFTTLVGGDSKIDRQALKEFVALALKHLSQTPRGKLYVQILEEAYLKDNSNTVCTFVLGIPECSIRQMKLRAREAMRLLILNNKILREEYKNLYK